MASPLSPCTCSATAGTPGTLIIATPMPKEVSKHRGVRKDRKATDCRVPASTILPEAVTTKRHRSLRAFAASFASSMGCSSAARASASGARKRLCPGLHGWLRGGWGGLHRRRFATANVQRRGRYGNDVRQQPQTVPMPAGWRCQELSARGVNLATWGYGS